MSNCEDPKMVLTNDNNMDFTLSNLCRSPNFYVDPKSTKIIETGSQIHPYRTIKPVFAELLNHHSHSDRNFTIYLKENTEVYLEEDFNYILNITSVEIRSYSDAQTSTSGRATLMLTTAHQSGLSGKAAFHIMTNTDLRLNEKIAEGSLSQQELAKLMVPFVTLKVVRSSVGFSNVDIQSDFASSSQGIFVFLINLQDHMFKIESSHINVTNFMALSYDPLSIELTNIYLDSWTMSNGFIFECS